MTLAWRNWAWATALGVLLGLLVPLQNLHLNFYFTLWKIVYDTPFFIVFAWVFMAAIVGVERSVPRGEWPSLWRYCAGAAAASVVTIGLAWTFSDHYHLAPARVISGGSGNTLKTYSPQHKPSMAVFEVGFDGAVHGCLAMFIYMNLRKSRHAARVLADAEVGRSEAQASLIAAQLVAAHAQVDPAFVLKRLEDIEQSYAANPEAADAELDELIVFLRDAIPRLRTEDAVPGAA